jgi:hypothetical protein
MDTGTMRVANFIIGGTEKAGTTSVFVYLAEHPEVCVATNKETDFFRTGWTGDVDADRRAYARHFRSCAAAVPIVMEASPGYLGEASSVAPRIAATVPDVKLLFILRDPVERLYSSYHFHVGRLGIPENLRFEDYVKKCFAYDLGEADAAALQLDEWFLKTMQFGRYADYLEPYLKTFPRERIKVMFFECLREDQAAFMRELSAFLGIDPDFWNGYEFSKQNVTFSVSNKALHKVALYLNDRSERYLRTRPRLKRALVTTYKKINRAREGYDPMSSAIRARLSEYYRPCNDSLAQLFGKPLPVSWG